MTAEKRKCSISQRNITLDDIKAITEKQQNTITTNNRNGKKDAFEVALSGSKIYLKSKDLLNTEEE